MIRSSTLYPTCKFHAACLVQLLALREVSTLGKPGLLFLRTQLDPSKSFKLVKDVAVVSGQPRESSCFCTSLDSQPPFYSSCFFPLLRLLVARSKSLHPGPRSALCSAEALGWQCVPHLRNEDQSKLQQLPRSRWRIAGGQSTQPVFFLLRTKTRRSANSGDDADGGCGDIGMVAQELSRWRTRRSLVGEALDSHKPTRPNVVQTTR